MLKLKLDITEEGKNYRDVSDTEVLRALLEQQRMYREEAIFRGMSGSTKASNLRIYGTDNPKRFPDSIMALSFGEVFLSPDLNSGLFDTTPTLFDYCDIGPEGEKAIAIYDSNNFIPVSEFLYRLKQGKKMKDSLLAIVDVNMD